VKWTRTLVAIVRLLAFQLRMMARYGRRSGGRGKFPEWAAAAHVPRTLAFVRRQYWGASRVAAPPTVRWCGILLSYRRPHNLDALVRAMLRCDGCEAVIVSNNEPSIALRGWISVTNPRVHIIDQKHRRYPGIRMTIARAAPAGMYLMVDDDTLLHGEQMQALMNHLHAAPEVPHGVNGERRDDDRSPYPYRLDVRGEGAVDHLTNVYAFTDRHLTRYFERVAELGIADPADLANGEDIILSSCGSGRPRVHDLGPILRCASTNDLSIATHRTRERFFEERLVTIDALRRLRRSGETTGSGESEDAGSGGR